MSALALPLAALSLCVPQFSPLIHAAEYRSESGRFSFEVDPSDQFGQGLMQCRLMRGKSEVWRSILPWTAEGAGVANDGTVVAYTNCKCLRIAVIDPGGELRAQYEFPHETYPIHGRPLPCAHGDVLVHDDADLAHVRVIDGGQPRRWITIRLSTGERTEDAAPAPELLYADQQRTREREAIPSPAPPEPLQLERLGSVSLRVPIDEGDGAIRDVERAPDSPSAGTARDWPANFMIDRFGRVLIRERASQAVQVFRTTGERLFVCDIESSEHIDGWVVTRSLRVTRDGSVWAWVRDGFVQFDAGGKRLSKHWVSEEETFQGRMARWDHLSRYDSDEGVLRSICRRPDNRWIAKLMDCATLADGRAVLLEWLEPFVAGRSALHYYGADGRAIWSLDLPTQHYTLSVAGPWVLLSSYFGANCLLVRLVDKKIFRFDFALHSVPGLSADGRELLLLHCDSLELVRFALP